MRIAVKRNLTVPNILSLFRIALLPFLFMYAQEGKKYYFALFLFLTGLSDFLDGKIARKFHQTTELGKKLDSVADYILIGVLILISFLNLLSPQGLSNYVDSIFLIITLRVIVLIYSFIRFRTFITINTLLNKITFACAFFILCLSFFIEIKSFIVFIFTIIAILASLEEWTILHFFGKVDLDTASLFSLTSRKEIFSKILTKINRFLS